MWDGQVWGMHELFPDIPATPKDAEIQVRNSASRMLYDLVIQYFAAPTQPIWAKWKSAGTAAKLMDADKAMAEWQKAIKTPQQEFNRATREVHRFFESEDSVALPLWKDIVKDALNAGLAFHEHAAKQAPTVQFPEIAPVDDLAAALEIIAREVAKLDGFDVTLRSLAIAQVSELKAAKHWVVPIRAWALNDEWLSGDGQLTGSHDANGLVRVAYVEAMLANGLYDDKGELKDGLLDPDCIEGRDWNLSAGQYKPFDFTQLKSDKSVSQLIGELKSTEQQVIVGLDKLLAMVEGRE
jgi:type I restriction enzyme M protein